MFNRRTVRVGIVTCSLVFLSGVASAFPGISESTKDWKLENYARDVIAIWHTHAATCGSGKLEARNLSKTDVQRLWATVLAAKLANADMFVFYDDSSPGHCQITSFGMYTP